MHIGAHTHVYTCIHVCMYVCMYVYKYKYINININKYIYINTQHELADPFSNKAIRINPGLYFNYSRH